MKTVWMLVVVAFPAAACEGDLKPEKDNGKSDVAADAAPPDTAPDAGPPDGGEGDDGDTGPGSGGIGVSWTRLPDPPMSPRNGHLMAYSPVVQRLLWFGGSTSFFSANAADYPADTWTTDPSALQWTELNLPPGPHGRWLGGMAYASDANVAVVFGGADEANAFRGDLWIHDFQSGAWSASTSTGPAPPGRSAFSMVYATSIQSVLIFGGATGCAPDANGLWGCTYDGDVWQYRIPGSTWALRLPATTETPQPRSDFAAAYDPACDVVVVFGGNVDPTGVGRPEWTLADTWVYHVASNQWTNTTPPYSPPARFGHSMAWAGAVGGVLVFGGYFGTETEGVVFGDLWRYQCDAAAWERLLASPGPTPEGRTYAAFEIDGEGDRLWLSGGVGYSAPGGILGDFWKVRLVDNP